MLIKEDQNDTKNDLIKALKIDSEQYSQEVVELLNDVPTLSNGTEE